MRLETVLVGLLSLTVAISTDVDPDDGGVRGTKEKRRREGVQRRVKKSPKGKGSSKMGKGSYYDKYYPGFGGDDYYFPQQRPQHPGNAPAYYPPPGPGEISYKKNKDPRGQNYGSRLMQPKSSSMGKGKGKGKGGWYTYPPFPSPRPNPTPRPTRAPSGGGQLPTLSPTRDLPPEGCKSQISETISNQVSQATTRNPPRCCEETPPTAVFVTHAEPDDSTFSGFERFWDVVYSEILRATSAVGVCFVMTGYDPAAGTSELPQVLQGVIGVASTLPEVPSIMVTDPTPDVALMQAIRSISSNTLLSSIGIFNAGFNNIVVESIVSGRDRLPYIGYLSDAEFGVEAGRLSLRLLNGTPAVPLCYNARIGVVGAIAERCASFYAEVTSNTINPEEGVACSSESDPQDLANQILALGANVVWSHVDCCAVVFDAVSIAREQGLNVFVGCQDLDTTDGEIDFVTRQPIELQASQAASWAIFPVLQAQQGLDGRRDQYFPSLQSLVNTGIFSDILL